LLVVGLGVYSGLMVSHPTFLDSVTDAMVDE
jgi:hypothetical protein